MKATPRIDKSGNLAPDAVAPVPLDGGLTLRCVVYDTPGRDGSVVEVFIPAAHVADLLLALRDKARDHRDPAGISVGSSAPSPLLNGSHQPPKAKGPTVVVVDDLFSTAPKTDDTDKLRDAADDVMRAFFEGR